MALSCLELSRVRIGLEACEKVTSDLRLGGCFPGHLAVSPSVNTKLVATQPEYDRKMLINKKPRIKRRTAS